MKARISRGFYRIVAATALVSMVAASSLMPATPAGATGMAANPTATTAPGKGPSGPSAPQTAYYLYHDQTSNYVAWPTAPNNGTDTGCGRYLENTDKDGAAGVQIFSPETYSIHFKSEFYGYVNQARVYYTTDGSTPLGTFGTPFGTTQVSVATFTCAYADNSLSGQTVDVLSASIPPQPAGTHVKYIIGAWHSSGGAEVFANGGSCMDSTKGCANTFDYTVLAPPAINLIISEFRLRGTNGPSDEFVEIYNNSDVQYTVNSYDGSSGFALVAADGGPRFIIPNGTIFFARSHYLGVNSTGYSLAAYPAGNGNTAVADISYSTDIPDNAGIALFNTANPSKFALANRIDAVGSTSTASTVYKEGSGYPAIPGFNLDSTFVRRASLSGNYPQSTYPVDTNDNASDFIFLDTNGSSVGAGQRLGAPGPENSASPINGGLPWGQGLTSSPIDPNQPVTAAPNTVRDTTVDQANNSSFGTLDIRRKITNTTGYALTRLRFKILDLTTFPEPIGISDMRPRSSTSIVVNTSTGPVTVYGTTLEQPAWQPNGGGINSTMSVGTINMGSPLANGASINVRFLLGLQQDGCYRIIFDVPGTNFSGSTDSTSCSNGTPATPTSTPTKTSTTTKTATSTNTSTATNTATSTSTNTATKTSTAVPPTSTSTPTNTQVPPSATRTSTNTSTPVPPTSTSTSTSAPATATATNTGASATATNTSAPSTATSTTAPASATATATNTSAPAQPSNTREPTNTPVPPTSTATTGTRPNASATPTTKPLACDIQFSDVAEGSTFYNYVRCLSCRNVLGGYSDGTFRPNVNITRGQLSKVVSNAAGFSDTPIKQTFEDVTPGNPFYAYIERMVAHNAISGYTCGGTNEPCVAPANRSYFRPNANATRGQISKIVSNAAGYSEPATTQLYQDVLPGSPFFEVISRLSTHGAISGYRCGQPGLPCGSSALPYFKPNDNATRGQVAKIVSNAFFPNCQTTTGPR